MRRTLPADHPFAASALSGLGRAQLEQGRLKEAEQTLRQASQIATQIPGRRQPQLAAINSSLGRTLLAQKPAVRRRTVTARELPQSSPRRKAKRRP